MLLVLVGMLNLISKVFKNSVLGKIFGSKAKKVQAA